MTVESIILWNLRISYRLSQKLEPKHILIRFDEAVADILNRERGWTVVDVGAGAQSDYARYLRRPSDHRFIGVDISMAEMEKNDLLDERIATDVCVALPVPADGVDLLVSRATGEHLPDNDAFLRNAYACLKPGRRMLVLFTSRYAPFALINRVLLPAVSARILHTLQPGWRGLVGFPAHYDRTNYSSFAGLLERNKFKIIAHEPGYFSSSYFGFFVPFYLLSLAFDYSRKAIGIKDLASYNLFLAEKSE